MVEKIAALVTEILPTLVASGLARTSVVYRRRKIEAASEAEQRESWLWLVGFKAGFIEPYIAATKLVPEEAWRLYEINKIKGSYEQNELKLRKKLMYDKWRSRPNILKRVNEKSKVKRRVGNPA